MQYIKRSAKFENISLGWTSEILNDDGCHKELVRKGNSEKDDHGTLYVRYVTGVLQTQACIRKEKDVVVFRSRETRSQKLFLQL